MSNDNRLKDYNAVMIMKEEKQGDLHSHGRILIHEQDLEYQQKDLFWAFAKGDTNYIYPFDAETLKKRDHFISKAFQLAFTGIITMGVSNWLFFKQIKPQPQSVYSNAVKVSLLAISNLVPLSVISYQGFQLYNHTNDFLYEKYLKPAVDLHKAEREAGIYRH